MDYVSSYFITNYILLCIAAVLVVTLIRKFKTQKRIAIYILSIIALTVLISVLDTVKLYCQNDLKDVTSTTALTALLYVLRPTCIIFFILLSGQKTKTPWFYVLLAPLALLVVTNIFPLIDATKHLVFYFDFNFKGELVWNSGDVLFFRFLPHIVSAIYLVFLVYKSVTLLQSRHIMDAVGVLVCSAVVAIATIIETFFNADSGVYLLPSSIAVSTVFFYLFLYERDTKIDVLTGLFNRASYFDDCSKTNKNITGVIQLDMNGLKYINDNYGHLEGDEAIKCIAQAIINNSTRKMYAYRLGGDEFVVLAINESEENILRFVSAFKEEIKNSKYHCSIGYSCRGKDADSVNKMLKQSEQRMYKDKEDFYKTSGIERRRSSLESK